MTETATANRRITLIMTDQPPVRIVEADWPVIAHGQHNSFDGEFDFQACETLEIHIRVRRRADGQTLIYGRYDFSTRWAGRDDVGRRAGHLYQEPISPASIVVAIRRVGNEIAGSDGLTDAITEAVNGCIADLTAMEV